MGEAECWDEFRTEVFVELRYIGLFGVYRCVEGTHGREVGLKEKGERQGFAVTRSTIWTVELKAVKMPVSVINQ